MEEKTCPQCLKQLDEKARIYKDEVNIFNASLIRKYEHYNF